MGKKDKPSDGEKAALISMQTGIISAAILAVGGIITALVTKEHSADASQPQTYTAERQISDWMQLDVLFHENYLNKKFVDKYDEDGKKYSQKIAHMDRCRFTVQVHNLTQHPLHIHEVRFHVGEVNITHFSTQNDETPQSCEAYPDDHTVSIGEPKAGIILPVTLSKVIEVGTKDEIPLWFYSKAIDAGTIVALRGEIQVITRERCQFTDTIEVLLHPDSCDVEYGATEDEEKPESSNSLPENGKPNEPRSI